ncbi:MAG: fibronectin type III domain-containing protein [Candidatus Jacksonbacteria bacterium]|jgi:hypothetical protein|nr:fibronectin type III domain-containing protein [Candidatus Jacksonbacteria bacterium]MBT6301520.1 fibronectin type III domain-containing protein [Candidatus Jacksonbacteria bacterium]MBT6757571.1 fibronectin type III domain-containing protein [Candidatus Jacksonbacteria bacterium]MBT6955301.1 fibronectin type III domain-containing protein [Candidatus Jacksonbacteria bacterium]MBT7008119.1 fibronectin type III domain-containing protein [Candidatus Jacksonbacteria bacterium]
MNLSIKTKHNIAMVAIGGVLVFVVMVLIASFWSSGRTTSYTWSQSSWAGGTDGGTRPDHTSNQSGWTKYDSKDAGVVVDGSNNVVLDDTGGTTTHTTDADFNSGTVASLTVSSDSVTMGSGTSNAAADTALDFDAADDSDFTHENSNSTALTSGVASLSAQADLGDYSLVKTSYDRGDGLTAQTGGASGFTSDATGNAVTDDWSYQFWVYPEDTGLVRMLVVWQGSTTGGGPLHRLKLNADDTLSIFADDGTTNLGTTTGTPMSDRDRYYFVSLQYEYNAGTSRYYLYVDRVLQALDTGNDYSNSHANINDGTRMGFNPAGAATNGSRWADIQLWMGRRTVTEQITDMTALADDISFATLDATSSGSQELIYWMDFANGHTGSADPPFRGEKTGTTWSITDYSSGGNTAVWTNIHATQYGTIPYDTSTGYYISTSDENQINTTNWLTISSIDTTETEPTNTTMRYLVSFDDRANWSYWTGSAWATTAVGNVHTTGMSKTTLEAISEAQWGASGGFDVGDTDLDFTFGFKTTDPDATPSVDLMTVNNTVSKSDITLDFDAVDEGNFTEETVSSDTTEFSSGVVQLPQRTVDLGNYVNILSPGARNDNIPALTGGTSGFADAGGNAVTDDWTFNFWFHPGTTGAMDMLDQWNYTTAGGAVKFLYLNSDGSIKILANDGTTAIGTTTGTPLTDRTKFYHISLQYEYNFGSARYYVYVDSVLQPLDNGFNYTDSHSTINDGVLVSLDPSGPNGTGARFADNQLWKGLRTTTEQRTDAQAYADGSNFATHAATASGSQELIYWQDYESTTLTGTNSFRGLKSGTTWTVSDYSSGQGNTSTHTAVSQSGIAGYITTGHYLHTTDTNQIDVSGWVNLEGMAVTGTFAAGSITRYLISYDDRVTWSYWTGSAWATTALGNIHTTGMTRGTMEGITQANWAASGGFDADSTTTLDFAASLKSTGGATTPVLDLITIGYDDVSATSGTLESPTIDTGGANNSFGNIGWTESNTSVTKIVKFQVAVKSADSGWVSGDYLGPDGTTGTFYTTAAGEAIRAGDDGNQYVRYKATIVRDAGDADSASLDDVSLAYSVYSASATFTSSAFDTEASAVALSSLGWTEITPAGTDVQFQIRTAPDSAGSPGTWTDFCGPDDGAAGCSTGTYFTAPAGSETIDADFGDVTDDQWIQYKITLTSDGTATPTVSAVNYGYVVNTAPTISNVTATQGSNGVVTVGYDFADSEEANGTISLYYQLAGVTLNETLTSSDTGAVTLSTATNFPASGKILIDSEIIDYSGNDGTDLTIVERGYDTSNAAAHSSGTAVYLLAVTVGGDAGASITTGTSKSATWTAKTDKDGFYGTAVVRVLVDDGNSALQYGAANASSFNLDTKDPTGVSILIDASEATANRATLTIAASDDNTVTMNVTNDSGYADDLVNTNAGTYVTYATSKTSWILEADEDIVYLQIKDAKGNTATDSATTPDKPDDPAIAEISNTLVSPALYGMYVTWSIASDPPSATATYDIYRKVGAGSYSSLTTDIARGTNNYANTGLSLDSTYTYYIVTKDSDGNISQRSSEIAGIANGSLDTGEGPGSNDTTAPVISATAPVALVSGNSVTITYTSTAVAADTSTTTEGYVDYRITDASFSSAGTLKASNNTAVDDGSTITVVISGLANNTLYYYRIGAEDPSGNKGTDDNSGAGYTFTSESGPIASSGNTAGGSQADAIDPTIIAFAVTSVTSTTATMNMQVNEVSTMRVVYGLDPKVLDTEVIKEELANIHKLTITDLEPNTLYYARAYAKDFSGNESESSSAEQFKTSDPQILIEVPIAGEGEEADRVTEGNITETIIAPDVETEPFVVELSFETGIRTDEDRSVKEAVVERLKSDFQEVVQHITLGTLSQNPTSLAQFVQVASSELPPPTIVDGLPITEATATSAAFSWQTDTQANSLVAIVPDNLYNANAEEPYLIELGNSSEFVKEHFVSITDLRPATRYHYQIRSQGSLGPTAKSRDYEFQTLSEQLSIIVAEVLEIEAARATVFWRTSVDADSQVEYIPLNENGEPLLDQVGTQGRTDKSTDHTVELKGLESGTGYLLRVISRDGTGQEIDQFLPQIQTTRDSDVPILSQINALSTLYPGEKPKVQTLITWRTNEKANSQVEYWKGLREPKDKENRVVTPVGAEYTRNHVIVLTGLVPGDVYQYKVKSVDETGNVSDSEAFTLLAPSSTESVVEVIADNFSDIFGWLQVGN